MKTISLVFIAVLFSVSGFCRVRTVLPDNFRVLQSRCVDSVEFTQILVEIQGEMKVAVLRNDCNCVVKRSAAVALFGFTSYKYVKPRELERVNEILRENGLIQ